MTADETREYLDRLRARGIQVALAPDGSNALDVSGPVLPVDEDQLRAYAGPVAAFLRAVSQPEAHSEPPAQPETGPAPPVAPTPVLRFETPVLSVEGRPVTERDVLAMLRQLDDDAVARYQRGEIPKDVAFENARDWLEQHLMLFGGFPRTRE